MSNVHLTNEGKSNPLAKTLAEHLFGDWNPAEPDMQVYGDDGEVLAPGEDETCAGWGVMAGEDRILREVYVTMLKMGLVESASPRSDK